MGGESTPRLATTPRCRSVRLRISSVCHERGTMSKNPRYPAAAVPYLMIRAAAQGIDFYKEGVRRGGDDAVSGPGRNDRARGDPGRRRPGLFGRRGTGVGLQSPQQLGGTPVSVCVYVEDVDAFARRAEAAGAKVLRPVADQFYGERTVSVQDPFGHIWHFSTVKETLTVEEMMKRMPK